MRDESVDLDDARPERASLGPRRVVVVVVAALRAARPLPEKEELERAGLRDVEVVAAEDGDVRSAGDGIANVPVDVVEAGLLHEGREDRDLASAVEQGKMCAEKGSAGPPLARDLTLRR